MDLGWRSSTRLRRYAAAVVLVLVAVLLREALRPVWGLKLRYMFFFPPVMISGWWGGLGPGLLATALSSLAITYFWLPPTYSLRVDDPTDVAGVVLFLAIGALVSGLIEKLQWAKRRAEAHAVALQREIDGRERAQATATNLAAVMEALRTSEERYRLLFERNLAGIFRSHRDGRMLECNEAFVRLLGYASREEVLARNAKEFYLNPDDREVLLATLRPGMVISHQELQWRRADGTPMAVLWHVQETDEGYLEGIAIDISDRKRLEEAEREASELRAVANLANAAAHEINNPLTVIVGNLELAARQAGDTIPRIDQTLQAAKRVQEIVARMRRITRIEMADSRLPPMLDIRRSSD